MPNLQPTHLTVVYLIVEFLTISLKVLPNTDFDVLHTLLKFQCLLRYQKLR